MCAKSRSALRRNYIVILLDLYKNKQSVKKKILTDCCWQRWIRTTEDERQQIYSLPHLATLENTRAFCFEPLVGFEPTTPRLQITCSGQLS